MAMAAHDVVLLRLLRFLQIGRTVANVASVAGVYAETAILSGCESLGSNRADEAGCHMLHAL